MDHGSRMNAHMPLQPRDLPERRVFNHKLQPDTMRYGPPQSMLDWGAQKAKGAPIAHHARPHLSGKALPPNPIGIRLYMPKDEESGAYYGNSNHGWTGVALDQEIAVAPNTWDDHSKGEKLLY